MPDDSLENIYAFAEKAYIRMQAGDVLMHCLDDVSVIPMHQLVESLIVSGPDSIDVLREILAETNQRKIQVGDDLMQILNGLKTNLEGYGVHLKGVRKPISLTKLKPLRFLSMLRSQGIDEEETQTSCLQLLHDARELVSSLELRYSLLEEIEKYLDDWLWGVYYQSVRQDQKKPTSYM